jgi:hypothetical protein
MMTLIVAFDLDKRIRVRRQSRIRNRRWSHLVNWFDTIKEKVWHLLLQQFLYFHCHHPGIGQIVEAQPFLLRVRRRGSAITLSSRRLIVAVRYCSSFTNKRYIVPSIERFSTMAQPRLKREFEPPNHGAFLRNPVIFDEVW